MTVTKNRFAWLVVGALWALTSGAPAVADDTELFVGNSLSSQAQPNILFIVDNSGSMGELVLTQQGYDAATTYASQGCDVNRVYWRTGTGLPPDCNTDRYFNKAALLCKAATTAFGSSGYYTDNMAQYDPTNSGTGKRWETIAAAQKSRVVECQDDRGIHGNGVDTSNLYARNGSTSATGYWGTAGQEISWGQTPANETYTLYTGNYLNWAYGPTGFQTRLEVVQNVATNLLDSVSGVNVGLMYFNPSINSTVRSEGGLVGHAMEDITTARAPMKTAINALTPETYTPLSETLYEAAQYYRGGSVEFGTSSVAASRLPSPNQNTYKTPLDYNCQKSFIVLLTDGEPTGDSSADGKIKAMSDSAGKTFSQLVGNSCDVETYPAGFSPSGGDCLDDLAEFLHDGDFSPLAGQQNVSTYTVGFTVDLPVLADTAARGGGQYYTADDTATLSSALSSIVTSILTSNTTFTAPTVAVNSFNRTQNLSDMFISVFRPSARIHWPGNLKKYRFRASDATIVDANGAAAVNPTTGFFYDSSRSFWSTTADGQDVEAGGAANLIPVPANRKVFTYLGDPNLSSAGDRVAKTNTAITNATLNTGATGDPTRDQVIDYINGLDLPDTNQNNVTNEPRTQMGDPLHSQPATVVYGPDVRDGLVFFATNDGFLHALDLETGVEQWAFVPPEFLGDQIDLYKDESSAIKHYGIDGNLVVATIADNDGIIESGEKVYLYFGLGRGGDAYYALDVTDPNAPKLMYKLDGGTLPGLGQTWSTPVATHVNVAGTTQNTQKLALVIGGGYEPDQDNANLTTDTIGNSIYIVDAVSGALLWRGSKSGATKNFATASRAMDYSIPADVRVIDLDGDKYADRMYAGDMGGQVWRFDITNGQTAANLVTGGVVAQLGGAPAASPPVSSVRRFYYAPDVAFVNNKDTNFTHIGIGSGHRAHPLSVTNQDRFYALRDYGLSAKTQAQFDATTIITDGSLVPVVGVNTNVPLGSNGWRLDLNNFGAGWAGEKVLAEARVFANQIIFSTFKPNASATSCEPQVGTNRIYQMSLFNGNPVNNLDHSADPSTLTTSDLFIEGQGGILSTAQLLFVDDKSETDTDGDGIPDAADDDDDGDGILDIDEDDDGDGIKNGEDPDWNQNTPGECVGLICFLGPFKNDPVRTFWTQENVDN